MKLIHIIIGLAIFTAIGAQTAMAQSTKIQDILSVSLSDSGPLLEGQDVKGYYFVYQTESTDKNLVAYDLRIHDLNLNLLKKKKITVAKSMRLQTVLYNGRSIIAKFLDTKEHTYLFKAYTLQGELIFSKTSAPITKIEAAKAATDSDDFPSFYSIPHFGYINYQMTKDKGEKVGYAVNFYSDNPAQAPWTFNSKSELVEYPIALTADSNFVYFNVMKRKSLMSSDGDFFITAFDAKTGKIAFEIPLEYQGHTFLTFSSFITADGHLHLAGRYFNPSDNVMKSKGLGLALLDVDPVGKIVSADLVPEDDKRMLQTNQAKAGEKEDKSGYFYFHNFVSLSDGRVIGIAESYSVKVSGLGVIGTIGGFTNSATNFVVEDLYLFEFSPSFKLTSIQRFDKYKSTTALPGFPIASPILYGFYAKQHNLFDYQFYQKNPDNSNVAICYLDYERRKGEANNTVLGAVFISDKGYTQDKFDLARKADFTQVFQGAFGSVVTVDYFKKEKSLNVEIKKLNY